MTTAPRPADAATRTVSLRILLAGEVAVSAVINVVFNLLFSWLLFPVGAQVALWGTRGLALDAVPSSLVPAIFMTVAISVFMRRRFRAGLRVASSATLPLPLPGTLAWRAAVVGLLAIVLVALPTVAILAMVWDNTWSWAQLVPFKIAFSIFHAVIVTPIVVLAALRDHRP